MSSPRSDHDTRPGTASAYSVVDFSRQKHANQAQEDDQDPTDDGSYAKEDEARERCEEADLYTHECHENRPRGTPRSERQPPRPCETSEERNRSWGSFSRVCSGGP